jgi:hypothetical protein
MIDDAAAVRNWRASPGIPPTSSSSITQQERLRAELLSTLHGA